LKKSKRGAATFDRLQDYQDGGEKLGAPKKFPGGLKGVAHFLEQGKIPYPIVIN
jgi:hypothetical protein